MTCTADLCTGPEAGPQGWGQWPQLPPLILGCEVGSAGLGSDPSPPAWLLRPGCSHSLEGRALTNGEWARGALQDLAHV